MKKYTKIAYIVLIIIILTSIFFMYKVFGRNNSNETTEEKTLSGIKHIENELENLFNSMNNISFENYKITVSETNKEDNESKASESSTGNDSQSKQNSKSNSQDTESSKISSDSTGKQYKLEETGILTKNSDIDWNQAKNTVEKIYTSLYSMTIDLYKTSTNQENIVNFNKEYDNLTKAVKEENKEETLKELSKIYNYFPEFVENCTNDEKEIAVIKTKNNIFKAYVLLDKEDWNSIYNEVNNATQEFTKLVTNISNKENTNQYNTNKIYIIINELQNAVTLKDKEVFLIKYKNLLKELQNI